MNSSLIAVRSLSSSAPRLASNLVKPPIAVFGIEGRYATALYSAASKEKKTDVVENDLKKFGSLLSKDTKLQEFVNSPLIKTSVKRETLETALKKQNFSNLAINLIGLMAENNRVKNIKPLIDTYGLIMAAQRGEVICEVTTAKPLDAVQNKELQDALKGFIKKGESIKIQTKVDPSIIGGMVVSIGERYVDMSIASKIKTYNNLIRETV